MSTFTGNTDGSLPFGVTSSPITIDSVTYIATKIDINSADSVKVATDGQDFDIAARFTQKPATGSATLQLATAETAIPTTYGAATATGQFTLNSIKYFIMSVGQRYTQGDFVYVDITFVQSRAS